MAKYDKGKIVREDGRSSLEEYAVDTESAQGVAPRRERINQDAQNTFGNGPDDPAGRSTGPNLAEDSPLAGYADLYAGDLKIEEFKFLECDPLSPPEEADPCPLCRPNPYAYVPDYRMMENGEVFFDGKNCTQNIVFTFNAPPSTGPTIGSTQEPGPTPSELKSQKFQNEQINRGIRLMLDYFNKADTATAYMYVPQPPKTMLGQVALAGALAGGPIGALGAVGGAKDSLAIIGLAALYGAPSAIAGAVVGASVPEKAGYNLETREIDCIKELTKYAEFDFSIPIQLKARTRVLISVPVEQLYRVPDRLVSEPATEFLTNLEVTFEGYEITGMARRAENAFRVYNNELKRWRSNEGGSLIEVTPAGSRTSTLDLKAEGEKIGLFVDELKEMLDELGFSLSKYKPGKTPEKIVIKFKETGKDNIRIEQFQFNLPGCPIVRVGKKGKFKGIFNKYAKKGPLNRTRTLHYIGALPEIDYALTARTPTPWLEVVTKNTYPPIEVRYGANDNTIFNDPTALGCLLNSAITGDSVDNFIEGSEDLIYGIPDLIMQNFSRFSCYSEEKLEEELKKLRDFSGRLDSQSQRVLKTLKSRLRTEDPYLDIVIQEIFPAQTAFGKLSQEEQDDVRKSDQLKAYRLPENYDPEEAFFERLNDRLGFCGWLGLITTAIDCVAQGLGEESATKALAEAAFNSMENAALSRTFLGLSPEQQLKIIGQLKQDFGNIPAPWETAEFGGTYEPGSYTGAGFPASPLSNDEQVTRQDLYDAVVDDAILLTNPEDNPGGFISEDDAQDIVDRALATPGTNLRDFEAASDLLGQEADARREAAGIDPENRGLFNTFEGPPDPSTGGLFGMDYSGGEFEFNQGRTSQGSGNAYGAAIGNAQKAAFDALRSSMLKSLGADELLEAMNRLPGAPIVAQMLKRLPCRQTPLIYAEPRLDSFMNTLEFDLCNWDWDLTFPDFDIIEKPFDLFARLAEAVLEAIRTTAIAILMKLLKLILEKIFNIACQALATLGANLLDLFSGNNHFRDLLKDNLCPDATQEDLNEALKNLFGAVGGPEASCLESMAPSEMGEFIDDLSMMLTQGQIIDLLSGDASEETIKLAIEVALTSPSACIREIFSDPNNLARFFGSVLPFIPNFDDLVDAVPEISLNKPPNPCDEETVQRIDELRCELLSEKGLTSEECREQIDDLKDKALQDLQDLANALQDGPFSNFPPLASSDDCPDNGFFPTEHPLQKSLDQSISKAMMENIEKQHLRDLWGPINKATGRGGFLNAVMSDTKGRPFKQHNWYVEHFGAPFAADLGFLEFHCNDAIKKPDESPGRDKIPINADGDELKGDEGGKRGLAGYSDGGYPPTVAAYLAKQYKDMDKNLTFSTTTKPKGFPNMQAALDEHARVLRVNNRRIENRKQYVEKWLATYGSKKSGKDRSGKRGVLEQDLLLGITKPLFFQDDWEDEDKSKGLTKWRKTTKKNSPEDLAREVLLGKQVLGGTGKMGNALEKDIGGLWGTEGKIFIDYYGPRNQHKLLELPDTSSADIILKYASYPDDPEDGTSPFEFTIEYDYNLFDTGSNALMEENKYQVKVVETIRSSKERGLTKREIRQDFGADAPPQSIYQTGQEMYTYPRYEFTVNSAPPGDVVDLLDDITSLAVNEPRPRPPVDPPEDAYEIEAVYRYFSRILQDASELPAVTSQRTSAPAFRRYFAKDTFDEISSGFMTRISTVVSTGKTKKKPNKDLDIGKAEKEGRFAELVDASELSRAFKFGFNPNAPKIIELDPQTYGGPLARLFPDKVPPPFYVQDRKHKGWMDICDTLVPEVSGCEPYSKAVYSLEDLNDVISNMQSELTPDQRLQQDPLCSQEAPYDKILANFDAANIEGAMKAVIRIYALDVFLRTVPVFTAFGFSEANYDDLMLQFVVERMKQGLFEDGLRRTGAGDETYYYRFLEQAVNNTKRKLDSGILTEEDMSQEELEAFAIIADRVREFYREFDGELESLSDAAIKGKGVFDSFFSTSPGAAAVGIGAGSSRFKKKDAKLAKDRAFLKMISETETEALVFLRRYVREELEILRDKFAEVIVPAVDNVDHLFLLSSDWIRGAVNDSGPYNVMSDPSNSNDYVIENADSEDYWPFVLEKYIKIHEKDEPPTEVSGRAENLYNIVNIEDWNSFVKDLKNSSSEPDKLISDLWGNPPLSGETTKIENHTHEYTIDENGNGRTSTYIDDQGNEHFHEIIGGEIQRAQLNPEDNEHRHYIEITGWSFGLRMCYQPKTSDNGAFEEIMQSLGADVSMSNKAYSVKDGNGRTRYLIPIVSAELPIPDQKFKLFEPDTYDVVCLIQELVKKPEYRMLFKYAFPLPRFISLLAMYSTLSFTDAIGNIGYPSEGGDLWELPGGRKGKKFRKWNHSPTKSFERSRQTARNVFEGFYEAAQAIDFDVSNDRSPPNQADSFRDLIRPKVNFEDGLRWWERGLRVKGSPYNVDGDEC
jgi:hypothetical protein